MKRVFKAIKMIVLTILGLVLLLVIATTIFVNTSPQFGGKPDKNQKERYAQSSQFQEDKFANTHEVNMSMGFSKFMSVLRDFMKKAPNRKPQWSIPVLPVDSLNVEQRRNEGSRLTWFGHSAFLLEMDGKVLLLDPMLGDVAAPASFLGTPRYSDSLPMAIEKLPQIDAVLISHDHYDHLDYPSIKKIRDKVNHFYVPLGLGAHLQAWGIAKSSITELDWWEEVEHDGLRITATPSQHFSGRGLTDRFSTLWCYFVIKGNQENIFFGGDSGYFDGFKKIGEKYGPFDLAMLECGQYDERWADIHMFPEETAQAGVDLNARTVMPIHWGAFTLALHDWTDPIVRFTQKAEELGLSYTTPQIGEPLIPGRQLPSTKWWEKP